MGKAGSIYGVGELAHQQAYSWFATSFLATSRYHYKLKREHVFQSSEGTIKLDTQPAVREMSETMSAIHCSSAFH